MTAMPRTWPLYLSAASSLYLLRSVSGGDREYSWKHVSRYPEFLCLPFIPIQVFEANSSRVYIVTALVMLGSAIWQAKMYTVGDMIGSNAISGLAGAVNEAIFQVTVDLPCLEGLGGEVSELSAD